MKDFIKNLETEFKKHANSEVAAGQKAYMKNRFEFYGIKTPLRRKIQKPFLKKENLPAEKDPEAVVKVLWTKPEREFQYFAQELTEKYKKQFDEAYIELLEFMITRKSWWDTVDFIAAKLVGEYFGIYPGRRNPTVEKWLASGNIWLQRTSILFQLKYKDKLDTDFLSYVIKSLSGSDEFFINKAAGWILREYGKTNPAWVKDFAENTELDKLTYKEALRLINRQ